ncbi:hypothetical protein [Cupriavidus nantongensis]
MDFRIATTAAQAKAWQFGGKSTAKETSAERSQLPWDFTERGLGLY